MRILFLAFRDPKNPFNGGGDIYINEIAKGCAKQGHSVTIISSKFRGCNNEETVDSLHVVRLGSRFNLFLAVFVYYFIHLRGHFDVVVEEVIGGPRVPFFASLYMKEKIVGIIQQRHKEIFRQQFSSSIAFLLSVLERFLVLLYKNNQLIVNSERTKEDLRGIGYYTKNMHVVYPGIPEDFFCPKNKGFSDREEKIICLTKMRRYKLVDNAIRAMQNVLGVRPNCKLVIAGKTNDVDPEYERELMYLVKDLHLNNNVYFERNISEKRKIELLCSSRALVLPSAIEGFSIVVVEANACGTPAITSDKVPAAIDGRNAIVTPLFNVDSLSKAILILVSDEKRWNELSSNSYKLARNFTWNATITKAMAVIEIAYKTGGHLL